jgi:hypothetical protein
MVEMHQRQAGCAAGTALSHQHAQMKIKASEYLPSSLWSVCVLGGSADGVCAWWQMVCSTRPKFTHHLFKFRASRHHLFAIQTVRYLLTICARDALCANIIIDISRRRQRQGLAPHDAPAARSLWPPDRKRVFERDI